LTTAWTAVGLRWIDLALGSPIVFCQRATKPLLFSRYLSLSNSRGCNHRSRRAVVTRDEEDDENVEPSRLEER
jgi:hypothetical protein